MFVGAMRHPEARAAAEGGGDGGRRSTCRARAGDAEHADGRRRGAERGQGVGLDLQLPSAAVDVRRSGGAALPVGAAASRPAAAAAVRATATAARRRPAAAAPRGAAGVGGRGSIRGRPAATRPAPSPP